MEITFEKVKEVIVETLNCDEALVTLEANLHDDLGADSLDSMEMIMALEEAFGVSVEEDKLADLKTVGDIMNYLNA